MNSNDFFVMNTVPSPQDNRDYIADKLIKGDLLRLVTAWNAGPGNLNKWNGKVKHGNDPLLFIESIPLKEKYETNILICLLSIIPKISTKMKIFPWVTPYQTNPFPNSTPNN